MRKLRYPPRPIIRYPTAQAAKTVVTSFVLASSVCGRMVFTTGRTAGCAPNAKSASGSADITPPGLNQTIGDTGDGSTTPTPSESAPSPPGSAVVPGDATMVPGANA